MIVKKTKILFILPAFVHGGAEVLVRNMLLGGFNSIYEVNVCVTGKEIGTFMEKDLYDAGVAVTYLGNNCKSNYSIVYELYKLIKNLKPHIIHTHLNSIGHALIPTFINRVPVRIHTVHNIANKEGRAPLRALSWIAFNLFGFIPIGISRTIGKSIQNYYRIKKVPIVNNGIPIEEYKLQSQSRYSIRKDLCLSEDKFVCIHVGRFFKQKNHKNLIIAFSFVLKKCPNAVLLLVGDGALKKEIERFTSSMGISNDVIFLGERADVPSLLSASDLFVFSSDWEGLPLAVIEALAAGLPVVSTDVGGMCDLVINSDNGYLVNKQAPEEFAEAILKIALNPSHKIALSQAAINHVEENFHIRNTILGHEKLYLQSLKDAGLNIL